MTNVIASSEDWAFLCKADEVAVGEIGTAKHPGEFYVAVDRCTHGAASFYDEGELNGHILECAWHNGTFDVRSGAALTMPCRVPLRSFETQVIDGDIYINPRAKRFQKPD